MSRDRRPSRASPRSPGSGISLYGHGFSGARFDRIVDGGFQRVVFPIEYVRSFYFLGQIAEKQGNRDKAREHYRRFVDYWKSGDLDRDRVTDAQKKLAGLQQ